MSEIRVDTISEKTSANGVAVDGLTIKDGGVAATAASTITTASADPQLTIISTEAGGGASPIIDLYRNSSSPADDDVLGQFRYYGENSADEKIEYVRVKAGVSDVTDGTEDSNYTITTFTGGSQFGRLNILPTETVFNENSTDVDFRVESNGNDHVLFVDGGNDHVNIGGSSDAGGLLNVFGKAVFKASDNSDNIELLTTDADGSVGPNLKMYRNSSSPADNDDIGIINFVGENDAGEEVNYAQIKSIIKDVTNGTEDGKLELFHVLNGALTPSLQITPTEIVLNESSNDLDFRVESNGDANMFFVNGGNDRVGIGSASPESVLHVEEGTSPKITVRSADGTSASIKLQRINENDASTDFELKNDGGVFKIISDNSSINERPLATFESAQVTFNEDSHDVDFRIESNSDANAFFVDGGNDRVGFFTNSPDNQIDLKRAGSAIMKIESTNNGDDAKLLIKKAGSSSRNMVGFVSDNTWHVGHLRNATTTFSIATNDDSNSSNEFRVTSSGVLIAGSLSKGSGSFKIEHPHPDKKDTHNLVHSFVEAPQADNIYRGKVDLVNGTAQVNIDSVADMTDGTFVLLNTNVQCFTSNESGWTAVKGSVSGNILTITAEDNSCTDTISWMVVGERHDQHMKDTDWTDVDGKVIVEPLKEIEEVE